MTRMTAATIAALLALAGSAHAGQCPTLAAKAEEALKTAQLDDAKKQEAADAIAKGKAEHDAGNHAESEATLNAALKTLGM